ncbi:MAG: N-acetyl-gamma-glutamyl-phosphate reductase [Actinobacteria bacterium]|nr:N-acetyl-gamma-glutamyl-phosphate reductase [Actinomycetota bacterium]
MTARIGIIGASGFTGAELLRICASHPGLQVGFATGDSQAGAAAAELYPGLAPAYPELVFEAWDPSLVDGVDAVFLGLPHGASQRIVPDLLGKVAVVVDLGADFRLRDAGAYERWYHEPHSCPELLDRFVYGLPEWHRDELRGADAVAAPGCYPTAATLALRPLVDAGVIRTDGIIVDAMSGVSGAGRPPKPHTTFCAVDENVEAYGLLDHRHTSEMDMNLGATVLFTPHLVPMNRGILATCYARPAVDGLDSAAVLDVLGRRYLDEPFVVVSPRSPSTKAALGTNAAHVTARFDERTSTVLAIAAIDNLGKGAAGQAVQCMNLALGLPETEGLAVVGTAP